MECKGVRKRMAYKGEDGVQGSEWDAKFAWRGHLFMAGAALHG